MFPLHKIEFQLSAVKKQRQEMIVNSFPAFQENSFTLSFYCINNIFPVCCKFPAFNW